MTGNTYCSKQSTCWNAVHQGRLRSQQTANNWNCKASIARESAAHCIGDGISQGLPAPWVCGYKGRLCLCSSGEILTMCSPHFPSLLRLWRHRPPAMWELLFSWRLVLWKPCFPGSAASNWDWIFTCNMSWIFPRFNGSTGNKLFFSLWTNL